jgi:hypothetical protein
MKGREITIRWPGAIDAFDLALFQGSSLGRIVQRSVFGVQHSAFLERCQRVGSKRVKRDALLTMPEKRSTGRPRTLNAKR